MSREDAHRLLSGKMKILSCGAGQQSTALALMSCDNVLNPGKFPIVPVYDAILFCDLGGEREWVYRQVDFLINQCTAVGLYEKLRNKPRSNNPFLEH